MEPKLLPLGILMPFYPNTTIVKKLLTVGFSPYGPHVIKQNKLWTKSPNASSKISSEDNSRIEAEKLEYLSWNSA